MASKALNTKFKGNDYNQELRMTLKIFFISFVPRRERFELVTSISSGMVPTDCALCLKIEVKDSVYVLQNIHYK